MASDGRVAAGIMLFGGGDIERLVRTNLHTSALLSGPAAWICAVLTSPVDPVKYIGDISPRPLFMMNGRNDPRIPLECSRMLHEAALEPKTVRWIDAGHVNVRSREFHELVSRELMAWLISQRFIERESLYGMTGSK
jgi:fermentation-respiration switch protein FrsA (DUF1100 family)